MNFEFVRWKKYEKQIQKLEGWINKDKLNFENNYQEITTVGLNVSETNEWLTVAYSLCRDEYLYPIQICKANIIERHSFNTEEVVEQRPLELTKEQEEYVKKDVEVAPSIVEAVEKLENTEKIPSVLYFKNHSYVSVKDYEKFFNTKIESKEHYDNVLNYCNDWIDRYEKSDPIAFYKEEYKNRQEYEMDMKFVEIFHILKPKFIFWDKTDTPIETVYMVKGQKVNAWFLPVGFYDDLKYPEQRKQKQELLDKFVQDYELYTQKELFEIYKESLDSVEIIRMIHYLIDQGLLEEHGKHWRTKKGLIIKQSKSKSTKSNKLTKEQEQFIIDNYERYTQIEFAEHFGVKKHLVGEKINKLVKKGIVPKHERGWTRYSKEYQEFRNIISKEKEETKQLIITEEQQNTLIKYYNMGIKATDLASQVNLPIAKVYEIIRSLVSEGKIVPRIFYLGHYIYYTSQEELEKKKQEINEQLSSKQKADIKEVEETKKKLQLSTKQIKNLLKKEKITGNENVELIYSIPTSLGGTLKLDPPINKKEFVEDSKTLDVKELVKKYGKPVFVVESLLKDLNKPRTIKFLLDKNTNYKWVFKTPLVIDEYLKDKNTMSFEELRSKYRLSPKVFKMLDSFISRV